jgi:hypothetical protein
MDQIYKTVPEGAIVTRKDLKEAINSRDKLYAVITTGNPASDGLTIYGPAMLFVVDVRRAHMGSRHLEYVFFDDLPDHSEDVELGRFSIDEPMGNYFFTNYWHAYAYKLRTDL